jgi:hypothetical protein
MDESTLQGRLRRIERLQYLVLVLLLVPYLVGVGELLGYWIAGSLAVAVSLVVLTVRISRRRRRGARR